MELKEYKKYNEEEILQLYSEVGWTAYTDDMAVLRSGFENSLLVMAALFGMIKRKRKGNRFSVEYFLKLLGDKLQARSCMYTIFT